MFRSQTARFKSSVTSGKDLGSLCSVSPSVQLGHGYLDPCVDYKSASLSVVPG